MKLLIASDIHGSATWCEKLMGAIEAESPDKVVLLGDLLYHGPRNDLPEGYAPKQVILMLNGIAGSIAAVRGNCEAEVDQMVLDFPCMADYALLFDGTRQLFCTHGHLWNPDNMPAMASGKPSVRAGEQFGAQVDGQQSVRAGDQAGKQRDMLPSVLLYGHTHVKQNQLVNDVLLVNPGSVSIPKDGSHSIALYCDGEFELRELQ